MSLVEIAYLSILGKPLIFYLGILTYLLFVFTAILGYSNFKGRPILPFAWHPRIAVAALISATIHGLLALSAYIGF